MRNGGFVLHGLAEFARELLGELEVDADVFRDLVAHLAALFETLLDARDLDALCEEVLQILLPFFVLAELCLLQLRDVRVDFLLHVAFGEV